MHVCKVQSEDGCDFGKDPLVTYAGDVFERCSNSTGEDGEDIGGGETAESFCVGDREINSERREFFRDVIECSSADAIV